MKISINQNRLQTEIDELALITEAEPPVVTRVLFSEADLRGRALVKNLCREAGLILREDVVGNIFARWTGLDKKLPAVATGSHIDAIPNAGKYDGVVGVLGAIEAIRALKKSGFQPKRSIELIIFTAEEPTRFGIGCLGSRLLDGVLLPEKAAALRDRDGKNLEDLRVEFFPQFNGAPLGFDALKYQTVAGQKISVSRLDFLASEIALRRADGIWIGQTNWFADISARDGKTNFTLENIPAGNYDRMRFQIGLPPEINHGDAAQWPAGHALNPDVNHLYWGWSREYVFLALEGGWQNGGSESSFSFHLATDRELMTVELPVALEMNSSREIQVALDVSKIFSAPNKIELSETSNATHSRMNDSLADELRQNVEAAFAVENVKEFSPVAGLSREADRIEIAPDAMPYRFSFSKFFPQPDLPRDNPLTGEGVALGGKLFFDRRLSSNNRLSCAACHRPNDAFSDPRRFSRGVDGEIGTRNAMALENLAWKDSFFWDGRAKTLREQVLQPIQNPIEMHESLANAVAKISADKDYSRPFANTFGSPQITSDKIARALEQFLRVQVSFDSKFDRVMNGVANFTAQEQRGFELFNTEYDPYHGQFGADCFHCHGGPLLQSQDFANNGLDSAFYDLGRYQITKRAGDAGKFAVPSLRNVAVTAPYMHDGRFRTLEEVVEHYCTGMKRSATLDPNLAKHPDGGVPLSAEDKKALVAFLKTLTDEKYLRPIAPAVLAAK